LRVGETQKAFFAIESQVAFLIKTKGGRHVKEISIKRLFVYRLDGASGSPGQCRMLL
jgi:hypothetical protein